MVEFPRDHSLAGKISNEKITVAGKSYNEVLILGKEGHELRLPVYSGFFGRIKAKGSSDNKTALRVKITDSSKSEGSHFVKAKIPIVALYLALSDLGKWQEPPKGYNTQANERKIGNSYLKAMIKGNDASKVSLENAMKTRIEGERRLAERLLKWVKDQKLLTGKEQELPAQELKRAQEELEVLTQNLEDATSLEELKTFTRNLKNHDKVYDALAEISQEIRLKIIEEVDLDDYGLIEQPKLMLTKLVKQVVEAIIIGCPNQNTAYSAKELSHMRRGNPEDNFDMAHFKDGQIYISFPNLKTEQGCKALKFTLGENGVSITHATRKTRVLTGGSGENSDSKSNPESEPIQRRESQGYSTLQTFSDA